MNRKIRTGSLHDVKWIVERVERACPKKEALSILNELRSEIDEHIERVGEKKIRKGAPMHFRADPQWPAAACSYFVNGDNATTVRKNVTCKKCLRLFAEGRA